MACCATAAASLAAPTFWWTCVADLWGASKGGGDDRKEPDRSRHVLFRSVGSKCFV